jgi:hypothetical protein
MIGLTADELTLFFDILVKGNNQYWVKRLFDVEWRQPKTRRGGIIPLNEYILVRHLTGDFWIAKKAPGVTDFFAVDIDSHKYSDVKARYRAVANVFGPGLPIMSSCSGGIHAYWFLAKRTSATSLGSLIGELLMLGGIKSMPGFVETFPGTIDHLRLPLGKGSEILHHVNLESRGLTLCQSIRFIAENRSRFTVNLSGRRKVLEAYAEKIRYINSRLLKKCKLVERSPLFSIPDLDGELPPQSPVKCSPSKETLERLDALLNNESTDQEHIEPKDSAGGAPSVERAQSDEQTNVCFKSDIPRSIVSSPIAEYGTRNDRMLKAVQEQMIKYGRPAEETKRIIIEWMRRSDLGHKSNDLKLRPAQVEKQVNAAVDNFAAKLKGVRQRLGRSPLSLGDVQAIVELTRSERTDGRFGREQFYTQLFLFHLLGFFKSRESEELPIPSTVISRMDGASHHTAGERMTFCVNNGIVVMTREEQQQSHRCRTYRLEYEFREGNQVSSFEEGLFALYDLSQLFKMYTRGIYDRLTRC